MLFREVFLGELGRNNALDWGGDPDIANVPARLSPVFPTVGARIHPYTLVTNWIHCGRLQGRQVDWGAYAAYVTRRELYELLVTVYGAGRLPADIAAFVLSLPSHRRYAIIAAQLEELPTGTERSSILGDDRAKNRKRADLRAIDGGTIDGVCGENKRPPLEKVDAQDQLRRQRDRIKERLQRIEPVIAGLLIEIKENVTVANALRNALVERDIFLEELEALQLTLSEARPIVSQR